MAYLGNPTVSLRVSPEALRDLLKLPESMQIVGVGVTLDNSGAITLEVLAPDAPEDAVEMDVVVRSERGPDVVKLHHIEWLRSDHTRIQTHFRPEFVKDAA